MNILLQITRNFIRYHQNKYYNMCGNVYIVSSIQVQSPEF